MSSDAPLAYDVHGSSSDPTVVLIHAIATSRDVWAFQLPVWAGRFQVVRVDLPGHGRTPALPQAAQLPQVAQLSEYARRVDATLAFLNLGPVGVVGLSLGGMIAHQLALQSPERVCALVLASTSAQTVPSVREAWEARLTELHEFGLEATVASTLARWFTARFAERSPMTMGWIAAMIRKVDRAGYEDAVHAIQQLDNLEALAKITARTLVVAGALDTAVPLATSQRMAEVIPEARLHVISDASHLSNIEQSAAFTEIVGDFLAQSLSESGADRSLTRPLNAGR